MRKERRDSHDVDFRPSGHKACLHAWVGRRGEARCRPPLKGRISTDRQACFLRTFELRSNICIDTVICDTCRDEALYSDISNRFVPITRSTKTLRKGAVTRLLNMPTEPLEVAKEVLPTGASSELIIPQFGLSHATMQQ